MLPGAVRRLVLAAVLICFGIGGVLAAPPAEKVVAPPSSPEALPRLFTEGAEAFEKEIAAVKARSAVAQKDAALSDKLFQELKAGVATLRASMAVKSLTLAQAEEALAGYAQDQKKQEELLAALTREVEARKKEMAAEEVSQATLKAEVERLKATRHPVARSRQLTQAFQRYSQLAAAHREGAGELLKSLSRRLEIVEGHLQLLLEIQKDLKKYVDETWKAELLKRQTPVSAWEQMTDLGKTLAGLPARAWREAVEAVVSGRLAEFVKGRLAQILGLLVLLLFLFGSIRRLGARANQALTDWAIRAHTRGLKALFALLQAVRRSLMPLALLLWALLAVMTLGMMESPLARLSLLLLAVFVAWRLGRRLVHLTFAGESGGGLLALDDRTARFYRRSLRLFLTYSLFGYWLLTLVSTVDFPPTGQLILRHIFELGLLVWALWLLRRPYLAQLLPELPGPRWLRSENLMRLLRSLVLLLLGAVLVSDLLGFQNLAFYLGQATATTGLAFLLAWFLWLGADRLLTVMLHPRRGWAGQRFPEQEEALARLHRLGSHFVAALLALFFLAVTLKVWGVPWTTLHTALSWLAQGPTLGPLTLSPFHLALFAGTLYLTFASSRLVRSFLTLRVYPKTDWDTGIQYTISTTLHYVILIVGILVALGILGFPFANLAIVAGALGVGIGFGLQNIVNNFISGLILLFERPIKVGDLLVIDGQWGRVREIRVRSTIFETSDRATLIIPNSELISHKITNWTHYGWGLNRLTLKVGVSYGSDPREVTQVLERVCRANRRVVKEPPPQIFFEAYGDSSLNFNIWVHLHSPDDRIPATHELNTAIFEAFGERGIDIPFPQRDLHLKTWPGMPALGPRAEGEDP